MLLLLENVHPVVIHFDGASLWESNEREGGSGSEIVRTCFNSYQIDASNAYIPVGVAVCGCRYVGAWGALHKLGMSATMKLIMKIFQQLFAVQI